MKPSWVTSDFLNTDSRQQNTGATILEQNGTEIGA